MTTPARIERNLPGILGDLSAAPTPDYLDDVFARTGRTRQRADLAADRIAHVDVAIRRKRDQAVPRRAERSRHAMLL